MDQGGRSVRGSLDTISRGYSTGLPKLKGKSSALVGAGAGALGIGRTPRGETVAAMYDSAPAFKIANDRGIPNKGSIRSLARNRERMETLMMLPTHKCGTIKFDGDPNKRTIAPLTGEDTTNFMNMGLMSTLRTSKAVSPRDGVGAGEEGG